jgi:ubiquinone/menaquinone biosynthesis C-methylase UbiE
VLGTALIEGMQPTTKENSRAKGLTSCQILVVDAGALPFDQKTFDVISGRMGFRFFPNMPAAAGEIYRVLKTA